MFNILSIGILDLDWTFIKKELSGLEFELSIDSIDSVSAINPALSSSSPDLILFDHAQGIETVPQLLNQFSGCPLVFFSKTLDESIAAMKLGAEEFVVPSAFASNEALLIIIINKWMRHKQQLQNSEIRWRERSLQQFSSMFSSITNSMVRSLTLDEINRDDLIDILQLLGELTTSDSCSVGFFVGQTLPSDRYFSWFRSEDFPNQNTLAEKKEFTFADSLWSVQLLKKGQTLVINTINDLSPEAIRERKEFEELGVKSSLMVPLRVNEILYGFLRLSCTQKTHRWQPVEINIAEACAGVFMAVQLHWQYLEQLQSSIRALEQKNQQVSTINQMSIRLQRSKTMTQIYAVNEYYSQKLFPGSVGMIHLVSKNNQAASMTQWGEWPFSLLVSVEQIFSKISETDKEKKGNIDRICEQFERELKQTKPFTRTICLPLYVQSETIGLFSLFFNEQQPISEEILSLAKNYAERLALAISNLQLRDNLHYYSVRDPLTGLYNRRFMEHVFENELRRAIRRDYGLSVLMMDIDHFKQVNDSLGHEIGDIVLGAVAKFLKKHLRQEDIVCRYGGDEFVILLPQTSAKEAYRRADSLRMACGEIFKDPRISELNVDYLTLSFGIAVYPTHGKEPPDLLRAADHALYYSKNHGRNQVRIAPKDITDSLHSKTRQKLDAKRWGIGKPEEPEPMTQKLSVLVGSNNRGKLKEIETILKDAPFFNQLEFYLPADLNITLDVDETGTTYAENATLKAKAFYQAARTNFDQFVIIADDSGLEVDALDGQPGIRSARYAPFPNATDADRRRYLLQELKNKDQPWSARFHCTIAMITPDMELHLFEGICPGEIIPEERGENGFGYDPIFFLPERGLTMAELPEEEKNKISHRGAALRNALPTLQKTIEN